MTRPRPDGMRSTLASLRPDLILVVSLLFLLLSNAAGAQKYVQVKAEQATARKAPSSASEKVSVLVRGETFLLLGEVPYWYQVRLPDGKPAYVAKIQCTLTEQAGEAVTPEEEPQPPLEGLYALPPPGSTLTVPACTPRTLAVDWSVCPAEGTGGANSLANLQKNRVSVPCSYVVMTHDQLLGLNSLPRNVRGLPRNDSRKTYLDTLEARAVVVEGYLAMVKKSDKESTNCNSTARKDFHFELVASETGDPKQIRHRIVITEITPWFSEAASSWTSSELGQYASYRGGYGGSMKRKPAKVRVYGWLFYDNWHADGSVGSWRGTAWEIHPVTRIEVWDGGAWRAVE